MTFRPKDSTDRSLARPEEDFRPTSFSVGRLRSRGTPALDQRMETAAADASPVFVAADSMEIVEPTAVVAAIAVAVAAVVDSERQ